MAIGGAIGASVMSERQSVIRPPARSKQKIERRMHIADMPSPNEMICHSGTLGKYWLATAIPTTNGDQKGTKAIPRIAATKTSRRSSLGALRPKIGAIIAKTPT